MIHIQVNIIYFINIKVFSVWISSLFLPDLDIELVRESILLVVWDLSRESVNKNPSNGLSKSSKEMSIDNKKNR